MGIIETKGLHKVYEDSGVPVSAVNGIDVSIEKGEFTAVVGPSGSGKTTFLNMVGGLDSITEGEVFVAGKSLGSLPERELTEFRLRHIGFVFQAYNLIPVLTAQENVEFIMELQGVPREKRARRARELLEAVGLGERLASRPAQLSGGQQQRVAVARALASMPDFVMADEPTANLDSKSTEELLDIMLKMNRESEITFVFATHDPRVVEKARRVITITDGRISGDRTVG